MDLGAGGGGGGCARLVGSIACKDGLGAVVCW